MSLADKYFKQEVTEILTNGFDDKDYNVRPVWIDVDENGNEVRIPAHTKKIFGVFRRYDLSKEFVYEMICDWWSFSHKTGNLYEIFDWYKAHSKKMILHENTRKLVEEILDKIKTELDKEKK